MTSPLACKMSRRQALGQVALQLGTALVLGGLGLPACKRPPPEPLVKAGTYGETPEELRRLWSDILSACRTDDRNRVHELMASLIMTQPELASLLGPQKATELWARYQAMMATMCNTGAVELVAHVYEKKLDDVSVTRAPTEAPNPSPSPETTPPPPTKGAAEGKPEATPEAKPEAKPDPNADTDLVVAKALIVKVPVYTARIKKKSDTKGLRYDFLVYRNGFWRSGSQLGKYLAPPATLPTP